MMVELKPLLAIAIMVCVAVVVASAQSTTGNSTPTASTSKRTTTIKTTTTTGLPTTTTTIEEECAKHNGSCEKCVSNSKCLYCKSNDKCMKYPIGEVLPKSADCSLSDARWGVCWVNFEALLIAAGVIGGVLIISLAVCVYCCCCRSKGKSRYEKDDAKYEQQKMERKVKQDERRNERKGRLDEIRRKYGLVKDDSPYNRFDA